MSGRTLHLACAVEGTYDAFAAVMLRSALVATGDALHVHLLHGPRLPGRSRDLLAGMVERAGSRLTAHLIEDERVAALPSDPRFTAAMWYRVFLPELLPDVERVLYLDVDTLVLDDLAPLWEIDLSSAYLGAVTNVILPHHAGHPERLGIATPDYFNSGVLLLNLDAMRRDRAGEAVLTCATERGRELDWPDQDALNLVLGGRRVALAPRWNVMNSFRLPVAAETFGADAVRDARRSPAIRHFEGPGDNKPWHPACGHDDRERWFVHRWATPWRGTRTDYLLRGRFGRTTRRIRRRLRR